MRQLVHGSTFSGIGGPEVAAAMLGWENAFHCEINEFGRTILDYYFPNAESYEDITKTDFSKWRGRIDVLTGGFPCQPFSYAGKRKGAEDDRYLWPYMLKCIDQIRPTWFVGENVAGITTMVFPGEDVEVASQATLFGEGDTYTTTKQRYVIEEICRNLESIGYSVQPMLVPACAVGAPHRRDRIFFIAHNERDAIADTNLRDDGTKPGDNGCTQREERIQERNNLCEPCISSGIRSEGEGTSSNTEHNGLQHSIERGANRKEDGETEDGREDCNTELFGSVEADGERGASSYANGDGGSSSRESQSLEGIWSPNDAESAKRRLTSERTDGFSSIQQYDADTESKRLETNYCGRKVGKDGRQTSNLCAGIDGGHGLFGDYLFQRWRSFPTVSPVHRGNDGLPFSLDDLTISPSKWRNESLKAYGNAIVPQVMYEIFRLIEKTYETNQMPNV